MTDADLEDSFRNLRCRRDIEYRGESPAQIRARALVTFGSHRAFTETRDGSRLAGAENSGDRTRKNEKLL